MANIFDSIEDALISGIPGFSTTLESAERATSDANDFDPEHWSQSLKYGFRIMDTKFRVFENSFVLQLNPQEIEQDEKFSIQITPTQAGVITEHQGSVLKDLTISGTTGFTPGKGMGGVRKDGSYRFARGETGYSQFHRFRNYIRKYAEDKKDPKNRNKILVFENIKDNEFLIVEPLSFKMKRSSSQRMLYNYNIVFKVIGRLKGNIISENYGWFSDLAEASETASGYLEEAQGIIIGAADVLQTVSNDYEDVVLEPIEELIDALQSFNQATSIVLDIPRQSISRLRTDVKALKENATEAVGIDLTLYNSLIGKTSTTQVAKENPNYENYVLLGGLSKAEIGLNIILSNNEFFGKSSLQEMSTDVIEAYSGNVEIANSTATITKKVLQGDTIQIIAARELGTALRFRELVILNQLKYPYISETSATGVLIPGDDILIPVDTDPDQSHVIISNIEYPINEAQSYAVKQLGTDFALDKDFDLITTNLNDFKLITAHDNAAQAVRIKLGLERGSLKYHPEIGNPIKIGEKITEETTTTIQNDLTTSILLDPRFDAAKFNVSVDGGTITITGFVKEKAFNMATPVSLIIQR